MRWRAIVIVAVGLCATVVAAQQQAPVFVARRDVVRIDVMVTEGTRSVLGLQAADFTVTDNGVRQQVDYVSFDELPLNVVLTFDASGSMAGSRFDDLRSAGHAILDLLRKDDRAALISFSQAVSLGSDLTADRDIVKGALNFVSARGQTALVDASFSGLALGGSEAGRSVMFVFSDGRDTSSWLEPQRVIDFAKAANVAVFGVATSGVRNTFLRDLVNVTGGDLVQVQSTRELQPAFVQLLKAYRLRYTIGYSPTGVADGGWHSLKVSVSRRGATVKARDGYQGR